jgi:hypothetical protein
MHLGFFKAVELGKERGKEEHKKILAKNLKI